MLTLPPAAVREIVGRALAEDMPWGDLTTDGLVSPTLDGRAVVLARQEGVLAGLAVAEAAFQLVDPAVRFSGLKVDGDRIGPGDRVAIADGRARSLLKAERVALNFLQRLSGTATLACRYVDAVAGFPVRIVDTRKTTPGLRLLEKYAVRVGGAGNHRYCLSDGILIKDNHLAALRREGHGIAEAIRRARAAAPHTVQVEIEVETLDQLREALEAGAEMILLDNMDPPLLRQAVAIVAGRAITEASGGITLDNLRAVAETGVDLISVGALTHSARALDLSIEFELG
ncbi:MAG: carboxylating nicotinate-nucleotide diphosphorylase [Chloroflexi bacterium]|nr:carboxylating nicotinate-nucleotide diphosphorylase [Chloroflexota bacterium]